MDAAHYAAFIMMVTDFSCNVLCRQAVCLHPVYMEVNWGVNKTMVLAAPYLQGGFAGSLQILGRLCTRWFDSIGVV